MFNSSGTGKPPSPVAAMWTKANCRVRDAGTTKRRKAGRLLAPASPAETTVVVAWCATSSSAGMAIGEPKAKVCACRSIKPGVTNLPPASITRNARSGAMVVSMFSIWP